MPDAPKPIATVESIVICEDARAEANSKTTLLGVYGGNILVAQFPAVLGICVWVELNATETGDTVFLARVKCGDELQAELDGQINFHALGPSGFYLPTMPIKVEKECDLTIDLSIGKDNWQTVKTKHVSIGNVRSGPVPAPPPTSS